MPSMIFCPSTMYNSQRNITQGSSNWSLLCLLITLINSCPSQTIVESIGGALSAFWCQGGQPANCSPGCPEWSHSSQMIPPLYCVLHTGSERRLWNLVEIRGVPLLRHQGACPTWPRNFIEIFPPCLQRITTFHWNRNVHQISHLKGDSPKENIACTL